MSDDIIRKVQRLLAIGGDSGASEAEVQNAMAHARRLIESHNLSEADLATDPADDRRRVDTADFDRCASFVGSRFYAWEQSLGGYVSDLVGCDAYADDSIRLARRFGRVLADSDGNTYSGKSLVFFGVAEDAALAATLFDDLRLLIATMARTRWGSVYRGDGAVYCQGFVLGLLDKLHRERRRLDCTARDDAGAGSSNALVLLERRNDLAKYKRQRSMDWLSERHGIELRDARRPAGARGSHEAWNEGLRDGRATDVEAQRLRKLEA